MTGLPATDLLAVVDVSTGVEESPEIRLDLPRDAQLARLIGGLQEKAVVPAEEIFSRRACRAVGGHRKRPDRRTALRPARSWPDSRAVFSQLLDDCLQVLKALLEFRHRRKRTGILGAVPRACDRRIFR